MINPRREFMQAAIREAIKARDLGDYAVGAVIARDNEIVGRGGNKLKTTYDPSAHAEVVAIRNACEQHSLHYLEDCILYSTHEPCPMCAAAAIWAKMQGIVYGATMGDMREYARSQKQGDYSWRTIDIPANVVAGFGTPRLEVVREFMRDECLELFHS